MLGKAGMLLDRRVHDYTEAVRWCGEYHSRLKQEVEARRRQLDLSTLPAEEMGADLKGLLQFLSPNAREPRAAGQRDMEGDAGLFVSEEDVLQMLSDQKRAAEEELEELKKSVEGVHELLGVFERLQGEGDTGAAALLSTYPAAARPQKDARTRQQGEAGAEGAKKARKAPVPSLDRATKARVREVLLGLCKLHHFQQPKFTAGQREAFRFMFRPQNKQLADVALVSSTSLMQLLEQDVGLNEEWISREYLSVCMDVSRDSEWLAAHRLRIVPCGTNGATERLHYLLGWRERAHPPPCPTPTTSAGSRQRANVDSLASPDAANAPPQSRPPLLLPEASPLPHRRADAPSSQLPGMSGSGSIHHDPCTPSELSEGPQTRSVTKGRKGQRLLFSSSSSPSRPPSRSKNLDHSLRSSGSLATVEGRGPSLAVGGPMSPRGPSDIPTAVGGSSLKGVAGRKRKYLAPPEGKEGFMEVWVDISQLIASIRHAEFPTREDTDKTQRVACHIGSCQGKKKICCNPSHIRFQSKRMDVRQREDFLLHKKQKTGYSQGATFLSNVSSCPRSPASDAGSQNKVRRRKVPGGNVRGPRRPPANESYKVRDQAYFNMKNGAIGNSFLNLRQHPETPAASNTNEDKPANVWQKGEWGATVEVEEAQARPPLPLLPPRPTRLHLRAPPPAAAPPAPPAAAPPAGPPQPPLPPLPALPPPVVPVAPPTTNFELQYMQHNETHMSILRLDKLTPHSSFAYKVGDCFFDAVSYLINKASRRLYSKQLRRHAMLWFVSQLLGPPGEESYMMWETYIQNWSLAARVASDRASNGRFQHKSLHSYLSFMSRSVEDVEGDEKGYTWADKDTTVILCSSLNAWQDLIICSNDTIQHNKDRCMTVGSQRMVRILYEGDNDGGHYIPVIRDGEDLGSLIVNGALVVSDAPGCDLQGSLEESIECLWPRASGLAKGTYSPSMTALRKQIMDHCSEDIQERMLKFVSTRSGYSGEEEEED